MRFRLLTLLLVVTALCVVLGLVLNADKIPVGVVSIVLTPLGIAMALLMAVWRKTQIPNKILLVVLFVVGWSYLMVYAEVVLATFRSYNDYLNGPFFMSLVGLFLAPAIVLCMLLLRSWLWAWHDRFDKE